VAALANAMRVTQVSVVRNPGKVEPCIVIIRLLGNVQAT
jgi:hypothetical protein